MIQGRVPKGLQDFGILKLWRDKRKWPVPGLRFRTGYLVGNLPLFMCLCTTT